MTGAAAKRSPRTRGPTEELTDQRISQDAERLGLYHPSEHERAVIRLILQGRDAVAVFPGSLDIKRAVEVAGLLLPQPVLIISPLVTMLRERCERLQVQRIPAVCIDPGATSAERAQALARVARGGPLLVYATPDTLGASDAAAAFAVAGIGQMVIGEAHALSGRAHELAVAYASLPKDLERLGRPPVICETSGIPAALRQSIASELCLRSPVFLDAPPLRGNLALEALVVRSEFKRRRLEGLLARLRRPGVILCGSAREAEGLYAELRALRLPVHRYHEALGPGERGAELVNFTMPGRRAIMVAVSAYANPTGVLGLRQAAERDRLPSRFGMGLKKRDLRFVIHYRAPSSLEQYVREIDLCAQDGLPGDCIMLYDPAERELGSELGSEQRIRGSAWTRVGHVVADLARHGRSGLREATLTSTGLEPAVAETAISALTNAGWIAQAEAWLKPLATGNELIEHCRRIAALMDQLVSLDRARLDAVTAFVQNGDCRSRLLAHYFGSSTATVCGKCDVCIGSHRAGSDPIEALGHAFRRSQARDFGVARLGPGDTPGLAQQEGSWPHPSRLARGG